MLQAKNLMTLPKIKAASSQDIDCCIDAIVLAFSTDPCIRWLIGVEPRWQNRGFGSMLLKYALFGCDYQKLPVYLEATNPHNVRLYERYGFEVIGTIQVGNSPPCLPMLRQSQ